MSNLTMPSITIAFKTAAQGMASRNGRGVVAIIVRNAVGDNDHSGGAFLRNADEIPSFLTAANRVFVENAFLACRAVVLYVLLPDAELSEALAYMATQTFSWLCVADASAAENTAVVAWIKEQRANNNAIYKAVLADCKADCARVVNFTGVGLVKGENEYTAMQYTSRVAGILAGLPLTNSATYYELSELQDVERMTRDEQDAAVGAGQLIAFYDGANVRLGRGVTSLTTVSSTDPESLKKIHVLEVRDTVESDLRSLITEYYIGKYMNSYTNKLVLLTAIKTYLKEMEAMGVLQTGSTAEFDLAAQAKWLKNHGADTYGMTEQEILEANTDTHVFLKVKIGIFDAMEDVDLAIYC